MNGPFFGDKDNLIAAAVVTAIAIPLLVVLNRRLRIFTKGTVTFMVTVSLITTVLTFVELGNDVRNKESAARSTAETNFVSDFVRSWLENRTQQTMVAIDESVRPQIERALSDSARSVREELDIAESCTIGNDDCPIMCINVQRVSAYRRIGSFEPGTTHWDVAVLILGRDQKVYLSQVSVATSRNAGMPCRVTSFDSETSLANANWRRIYDYAHPFKNATFAKYKR